MTHTCCNCNGSSKVMYPRCGGTGTIQEETCYYCNRDKWVECKA